MYRTFIILLFPTITFGQKINLTSSCSYYGEKLPASVSVSFSDYEAQSALNRILFASGLPTNFTLVSGNIPNACATIKYNEASKSLERFIIYNPVFMNRIKSKTNDWSAISILAHEVGHHLSGHSLRIGGSRPDLELEADKFSGFILQNLGASLDEATSAIKLLSTSQGSATHPSKFLRLSAIREGWFNAKGKDLSGSSSNSQKPDNVGMYSLKNGGESNEVYWVKTGSNTFDLICQGYKFSAAEYTVFNSCENIIIFMNDYDKYFYIEDFNFKPISSTNYKVKPICPGVCSGKHVVVKTDGGFWALFRGRYIKVIEQTFQNSYYFGPVWVMRLANGAKIEVSKSMYDNSLKCVPIYTISE